MAITTYVNPEPPVLVWQGTEVRKPQLDDAIVERLTDKLRAAERLFDSGRFYLAAEAAAELRSIARTTRHLPRWLYSQIARFSMRSSRMAF